MKRKIKMSSIYGQLDGINIIEPRGYGKTYHELNKFIKSKLLKDKKNFEKQLRDLEFVDNKDCVAYKCYDSLVCYIDDLIKFLEVSNEK